MPILPFVGKALAFGAGIVAGEAAVRKGVELVKDNASDVADGALGGIQQLWYTITGQEDPAITQARNEAKAAAKQAAKEAKAADKEAKAAAKQAASTQSGQAAEIAKLKAELAFQAKLDAQEKAEMAKLRAAKDTAERNAAQLRLRNTQALRQASAAAAQPSAIDQLKQMVAVAKELVSGGQAAPDAQAFAQYVPELNLTPGDEFSEDNYGNMFEVQ